MKIFITKEIIVFHDTWIQFHDPKPAFYEWQHGKRIMFKGMVGHHRQNTSWKE